ncbi:hypothetical protein DMB90_08455 [Raoultella planticola]|uniref:Uncharacterized protein n=1 Tax=Raoultella planticola TaxID=575 RepID=A0A5P6A9J1_RAOPL|nr:hypothetical protein DMB90_08455 [Raoultella planticola]
MSNGAAHYAAELSFFAASDGGKVAEMINAGGSALRHMSLAVVELQPGKALLHRHIKPRKSTTFWQVRGLFIWIKFIAGGPWRRCIHSGGMYPCVGKSQCRDVTISGYLRAGI